jgi:hypothetical protein
VAQTKEFRRKNVHVFFFLIRRLSKLAQCRRSIDAWLDWDERLPRKFLEYCGSRRVDEMT